MVVLELNHDKPQEFNHEDNGKFGAVTSAGGFKAVCELLSSLSAHFPAPIVLVRHIDPIAELLSSRCNLKVKEAEEGDHRPLSVCQLGRVCRTRPAGAEVLDKIGTESEDQLRPSVDQAVSQVA